jgi:uncharacterized protein
MNLVGNINWERKRAKTLLDFEKYKLNFSNKIPPSGVRATDARGLMKTLIIGASTEATRYSNMAANRLLNHGHEIKMIGKTEGEIRDNKIETGKPDFEEIDTVTMYVNPARQAEYYDYVVGLKPRRVIFNPGTENPEFEEILTKNNIEPIEACTLVMLSIGNY